MRLWIALMCKLYMRGKSERGVLFLISEVRWYCDTTVIPTHIQTAGTLFAFVKVGVTTRHAVACLDAPLLVPSIPELENGQWLS